jgi:predicted amidohydrolase
MDDKTLNIALAQIDPEIGNLEANLEKVRAFHQRAREEGAELVVFPELALSGYALGEEVRRFALSDSHPIFQEMLNISRELPLILGYIERSPRARLFNSAALLDNGDVVHVHRKVYLPNYSVWEEQKHFARGRRLEVFPYRGFRFALFICNDFWYPSMAYLAASDDADVFVVLASSALDTEGMNPKAWDLLIRTPALVYGAYVIFSNRVGMEHDTSFWGGSTVVTPASLSATTADAGEQILHSKLDREEVERARDSLPILRDLNIDFTLRELQYISERRLREND